MLIFLLLSMLPFFWETILHFFPSINKKFYWPWTFVYVINVLITCILKGYNYTKNKRWMFCMHAASAGVLGKCWFETETQVIFEGDQLCTLYRIQQSRQKHFTHARSHNEHRDDCRLTPCVSAVSCRCHTRQKIHIFSFIPCEKKTATSALFIIQCF